MKTRLVALCVASAAMLLVSLMHLVGSPGAATAVSTAVAPAAGVMPSVPSVRTFKILHLMSYDSSWSQWTVPQLEGFKEALQGVRVEYQVIEMDVRRNTSDQWKQQITAEACHTIDTWKPDLVYVSDDFGAANVITKYLNTDTPFVFSGVNADPATYGFVGSTNVTGVLEGEHILQTLRLLNMIVPQASRIAVITDRAETYANVIERIKQRESEAGVELVAIDVVDTFDQWKDRIRNYHGRADAICTLGMYVLKGSDGKDVPMQEVSRWTYDNCSLPNISFWESRIPSGVLCTAGISAQAQGLAAGTIARQILLEGCRPSEFEIQPTVRAQPLINLSVARHLGLHPSSTVLLTAKVIEKCEWE